MSVQQATLCFLIRGRGSSGEVCLALKKRGFGEGLWNGVGGKVHEGETIKQAASREVFEEIAVNLKKLKKVAILHFYFPNDPKKKDWNQDVHVFLTETWGGEPKETEEMMPRWFKSVKLPFAKMWASDPFWLPKVLAGKKIVGWFNFDDNNKVSDYKIKNVGKGTKISS